MKRRVFLKLLALLPFGGIAALTRPPIGRFGGVVAPVEPSLAAHPGCMTTPLQGQHLTHTVIDDHAEPLTVAKLQEAREYFGRSYQPKYSLVFPNRRAENQIRRLMAKQSREQTLDAKVIKWGFKPDPVRYDPARDALVYDHRLKIPKV